VPAAASVRPVDVITVDVCRGLSASRCALHLLQQLTRQQPTRR